eukprot:1687374-Alexandrium_andersonii.AAC.1
MRGARDGGVARARRERRVRAWARHCAAAWRGGWVLGAAAAAERVRQEVPQDGQVLAGPADGADAEAGAERIRQDVPRDGQ